MPKVVENFTRESLNLLPHTASKTMIKMNTLDQLRKNISSLAMTLMALYALDVSARGTNFRVAAPVIPDRSVNLTNFTAVADGTTLNTDAFAAAITALSAKGGGELVVPPGYWLTGPIRLQSNINLHLERGAFIQFSRDFHLYPLVVIRYER